MKRSPYERVKTRVEAAGFLLLSSPDDAEVYVRFPEDEGACVRLGFVQEVLAMRTERIISEYQMESDAQAINEAEEEARRG